jgi:hypothetical protein
MPMTSNDHVAQIENIALFRMDLLILISPSS